MVQWTSPNQMDSIYAGDNAFNNGEVRIQQSATDRRNLDAQVQRQDLHRDRGLAYSYERRNRRIRPRTCPFKAARFRCNDGYAPEWAVLNYTMFRISRNAFFTVRNEYMNDKVGSRTGLCYAIFGALHRSHLVAGQDSSRFVPSFDLITRTIPGLIIMARDHNQLAFITDVIYHF